MADRTLRVPGDGEPTFWNRSIGLGAAIGWFVPLPFASVIGGVVGGFLGKSRMEKEQDVGKDVSPPTFWNRSIVTGAALGHIAALLVGVAVTAITAFNAASSLGADASHEAISTAIHGTFSSASAILSVAALSGLAGGALLGGVVGKNRMEREYKEAQQYVAENGEYKGRGYEMAMGKAQIPQRAYTVTPEEAALLESRLSGGRDTTFADRARTQQLPPAQPNVT